MDKNGRIDPETAKCASCGRAASVITNGTPLCKRCQRKYDGEEKVASMEPE